ncbi:transcription factor [Scheffersomyces amazonensis]|uniref:transcription factor n=1 Tax=Scheffersomyces amazonensis TaxID=1078765 RepID=UPI00315D70DB
MGNVSAKESRSRSSTFSSSNGIPPPSGDITGFITRSSIPRRYTTSTIGGGNSLGSSGSGGLLTGHSNSLLDFKKSKRQEEKDRIQEAHYQNLIVRYNENVDGGYLAPYGTYKSNLDYNTEVVRNFILNRQLSPFYTPLQDFDESWTQNELLIILNQLPLHAIDVAYSDLDEDAEDDIDNHKIHKSSNYYKRQEQKQKLKNLLLKIKNLQKEEDLRYLTDKQNNSTNEDSKNPHLSSNDLLLQLYGKPLECPICFLYYPANLNISRCCLQPICTECFVQIKRLDPHPPHDESSNTTNDNEGEEKEKVVLHTLISEAASCPYCASPDFGVTYDPPFNIFTGMGSKTKAGDYIRLKSKDDSDYESDDDDNDNEARNTISSPSTPSSTTSSAARRRSSLAANAPGVITIDMIRPDWEQRLSSARSKLERKAATATAIHASNLLLNGDEDNNGNRRRRQTESSVSGSSTNGSRRRGNSANSHLIHLQTVEDRMLEEALRLSIIDEEERKRKVEAEEKKKKPLQHSQQQEPQVTS